LANASLIKKIKFPRNIIPFTVVLQDAVHFLCSIPVVIFFTFLYRKHPHLSWLYGIPLLVVIQFLMTYGVSMLVASLNLFFRDLERLTGIFMTLLFYFTPIIYPEAMIPETYQWVIGLNPTASLMISWRNLFLTGRMDPFLILLSLLYSFLLLSLGYVVYRKLSWKFAEVL
jgi:lipopolysaccharide transport system permease protein